jgi:hypothetical protein
MAVRSASGAASLRRSQQVRRAGALHHRPHLFRADGERKIMIASLRYLDTFANIEGAWYFQKRKLILDWSEA